MFAMLERKNCPGWSHRRIGGALAEGCAARTMARGAATLDQAVTVENRMDRALGLTSPSSRLIRSSRILRAPQCGFSPQSGSRSAVAAGWPNALAGATDRLRPQAR